MNAKERRAIHDERAEIQRRLADTGPDRPRLLDLSSPEKRYRLYLERVGEAAEPEDAE
jgi:hypothetical protein